jgi:hypothetical protein
MRNAKGLSRKARIARAQKAARTRWDRVHAESAAAPRETRCVEITIRDSHRMQTVIVARQSECGDGRWSRWTIDGVPCRPLARHGLARHIAEAFT